jgi:hypothetical protein
MKSYIYILILFVSCRSTEIKYTGDAGEAISETIKIDCGESKGKVSSLAIHCLRNFLVGEDGGGMWQQIGTTPQNLSALLIGENPCFEWSDKACGQYEFRYIVGDACCRDTSIVRPLKCCPMGAGSSCN